MVVGNYRSGLEALVGADFGLFAGLARLLYDEVGDGAAVNGEGLEFVGALALVVEGEVDELLGELDEAGVLGYEVGLAVEGDDDGEVTGGLCDNAALGSVAVLALGGDGLAFLAENLYSGFHVAVGLVKGGLAVAESGAGEFAEFFDIFN